MTVIAGSQTLAAWSEAVREADRESFALRYRHPFLVQELAVDDVPDEDPELFAATRSGQLPTGGATGAFGDMGALVVIPLVKSDSGEFAGLVNVGRTANNDLVLDHSRISKFHAWFSRDVVTRRFQVGDAGSTNGTFVNEVRLPDGGSRILGPRDLVGFAGAFAFRFHEPATFHELVRLVAA